MRRPALLVAAWLSAAPAMAAAQPGDALPLGGTWGTGRLRVAYAPEAAAGTHVNAVGAGALAHYGLADAGTPARGLTLVLRSRAGARRLFKGLGIPGSSWAAEGELGLALSLGRRRRPPERLVLGGAWRTHTLAFVATEYAATDSTSQRSGRIEYMRADNESVFSVQFENDFLVLQRLDRYRTFALRGSYRWLRDGAAVGAGGSIVLWTGTTEGLGFLSRCETYDLRGQHGGEYSHGILSLDLTRDAVRLSVGVDAEWVRTAVQNSFHHLIDDGAIPAVDRGDRIFVQLSVNDLGSLY